MKLVSDIYMYVTIVPMVEVVVMMGIKHSRLYHIVCLFTIHNITVIPVFIVN